MSFGGGYQQSESEGKQNSGLLEDDKKGISSFAAGLAPQIGNSGMGFLNSPLPSFNPGRYGIASEFDDAIDTLGSNMFSKASGSAAARGFANPANLTGVIGSAVRQAAPQLAQFADSAAQRRLFGPDQIMAQRYGTANNFMTTLAQLLGSSGSQSSNSFGFQLKGSMPSPTGGATG